MDLAVIRWIAGMAMFCCCLLLPGCSCDSVVGTYTDSEEVMTMELRGDGKAYVSLGELGTKAGEWEQDGEKVIVKIDGDSTVLTRNDDGSLDGGMMFGKLKRKE